MLGRDEALRLLGKYLTNERNVKHCIAVEAVMTSLARRLGEDEVLWGLVGLLHDIDYELVGRDLSRHGLVALELLKDILPGEALEAIASHNELTGFLSESRLAYALKAADHVSGLIIATALVMPSRRLDEVRVESLLRKFRQRDFARGVDRERILYCEKLGLSLEEFIKVALDGLREVGRELGL